MRNIRELLLEEVLQEQIIEDPNEASSIPVPVAEGGTGATTASGARTNLGLGSIATQNSNSVTVTGGSITGITDLAVADGGTGASDAATARSNLGAAASADLTSHTGNTSNPHSTTAAQVGADPSGTAASAVSTHSSDDSTPHTASGVQTSLGFPYSTLTTVYVDNVAGSDSNDGQVATPWATVEQAAKHVRAMRARGDDTHITINIVGATVAPARTYTLGVAGHSLSNVTFQSSERIPLSTHTINTITAAATDTGGVSIQVSDAPGWTPASSLRGYLCRNTTESQIRPISDASAADTFRICGNNQGGTQPAVPSGWNAGDAIEIYQPGAILDVATNIFPSGVGYRPDWFDVTFQGLQIAPLASGRQIQIAGVVTLIECLIQARLSGFSGMRVEVRGCWWRPAGAVNFNAQSQCIFAGCVFDGASSGSLNIKTGSELYLSDMNALVSLATFQLGDNSVLTNESASASNRACVFFVDSAGPTFNTNGGLGAFIGLVLWLGKIAAGATHYIRLRNGAKALLSGSDDVVQSDGSTVSKVSVDGGTTDAHYGTGSVEVDSGPAKTTNWNGDLPQDPGNTVYVEMRAPRVLKLKSVGVLAPVLGSSAAGTYVLDVLKNGTSMLTGTVNLETLVAGTWSVGTVKSDGTENIVSGDEIRVHAVSDNADLTGYTDGVMFTVEFEER